MPGPSIPLARDLADKITSWPEVRMGVNRVTLIMRDGSRIGGVLVAGARAVGLYTPAGAVPLPPFRAEDILDAEDDSDW